MKGETKMFYPSSKQIVLGMFVALLFIIMPVGAVETFKVSEYRGGHQIWFEAEAFDQRDPEGDQYYPVVDVDGAFDQAITRSGGAGGMIRWTFDINRAGGKSGTWYFWGRVLNPSNQSDYMLVEGHPGDPEIPTGPPYPGGDGTVPFENEDDRIFESSMDNWSWWGRDEGSDKELQDGENTMYIFHRQGNDTVFWDVFMWTDSANYTPSDEDYQNAVIPPPPTSASKPSPADGEIYLDTWASLAWSSGETAASHDVYFGESFDDVNDGTGETFLGNQPGEFLIVGFPGFAYPDGLVPGTTYYWRVDEVEADGVTKYKGDVWSFTIPPRTAYNPDPADGAKYVASDAILSWTGGLMSKLHHIYFGDDPDVIAGASGALPQSNTTYTPGPLELDKTYYWRVDEFDGAATYKGDVWSFTTLPDIPVDDPDLVGWWKLDEGMGRKALDWSGHDNHAVLEGDPEWVPGRVGDALELDGFGDNLYAESAELPTAAFTLALWFNPAEALDAGSSRQDLLYWQQGNGRPHLTFNRSDTGEIGLWPNVGGDFDGPLTTTRSWVANTWYHITGTFDGTSFKIYVDGNLEGTVSHPGTHEDASSLLMGCRTNQRNYFTGKIDDVRLYGKALNEQEIGLVMRGEPDLAWNPSPSNGSTPYITDAAPLTWSPGDFAAEHDVYFGLDRVAVVDADASDTTGIYRGRQSGTSYTPPEGVEWGGGPYYWRIDEINTDGTISTGRMWTFTVLDFILVEDFESYTDDDAAGEAIWQHWIDGFGVPDNGSQVGYLLPPYAERAIIHGGSQSMPLMYNNTGSVTNSEAVSALTAQRDWTEQGVSELSLWFHGLPASVGSFTEGPVGTYTITAGGTDIWGTADEFHYAYKTLTGGGSIEAKVLSVQNTDPWAKAGVMIRETLEAGSKFAAVYIMPTNIDGSATEGCRFQARTDTDIGATSDTGVETAEQTAITAPYWVKLERSVGGAFRGYYSSDGTNWQSMSWNPQSISMTSDVYVGLALTSHNVNAVGEAKFSNVRTSGTVSGQWANQDVGIVSNAAEPLYVAISNASGAPAVVANADPAAATIDAWAEWRVPLQAFADQGINLRNVDKIAIGLGSKGGAAVGGTGTVYIDDIRLYRP